MRVAEVAGRGLLALSVLAAAVLIALNAVWHAEAIRSWNALGPPAAPPGRPPAAAVPRRSVFFDIDCLMWNHYALQVAEGRALRVRTTTFDNHPHGREVHWSSGLLWLLALGGRLHRLLSGADLATALERASLLLNPLLNAALVLAAGLLAARRFGARAGALLALGIAGSRPLMNTFHAGGPDHHGLVTLAATGTVLGLLLGGAGLVRAGPAGEAGSAPGWAPAEEDARRWFLFSGVSAGLGLWVSAGSTALLLLAVAFAAAASLGFSRAGAADPGVRCAPELWARWGGAASAVGFACYLLEYFPGHLGLRLEVNHPLYHLALLGGAWLLVWLGRWGGLGRRPRGRQWWGVVAACAAVLALPALILAGGPRFYAHRDPLLWRWTENVMETQPLSGAAFLGQFALPAAAWALGLALLLTRGLDRCARGGLAFVLATPLPLLAFSLLHQRWAALLAVPAAFLPLAGALAAGLGSRDARGARGRRGIASVLAALALAQFLHTGYAQLRYARALRGGGAGEIRLASFAAAREAAEWIRRREGAAPVVLLGTPWPTVVMSYAGGFRGVATLYWENLAGIRALADILTATDDAEAARLVRERGITHLAFLQSDYNVAAYYYNRHGRRAEPRELDRMLGTRLTTGAWPWWIRQLPYRSAVPLFAANPLFYRVAIFGIDPRLHQERPTGGAVGGGAPSARAREP